MNKSQHRPNRLGRKPRASEKPSHAPIAEEVLLQPWFLPARVASAIHSVIPPDFRDKMRHFFDDYGCIICERECAYHSNGMCARCYTRTRQRLLASVKRHAWRGKRSRLDLELFRQERLAKKLLARFSVQTPPVPKNAGFQPINRDNPVYAAFAAHCE